MKKRLISFNEESRIVDISHIIDRSDDEEDKPFLKKTIGSIPDHSNTYFNKCSEENKNKLKAIEEQYKSVNGIYSDISTLVSDQSQDIILLDDKLKNIMKMHKNSNKNIDTALKLQNNQSKASVKLVCLFVLICIFIIVLLAL